MVLGEILVCATNSYLQVMPFMMWLSAGTLFFMVFAIVALALAVGATYPNFDADNAAKVASGAGGLVYMILCMSFIGLVVILEAWPVYVIFSNRLTQTALSVPGQVSIAASFAAVLLLIACVFGGSVRYGLRRLEGIEI
jgi:ABC-2 type transport system permease protein